MLNIFVCSQILNRLFGFNYIKTMITFNGKWKNYPIYLLNAQCCLIVNDSSVYVIPKRKQFNNVFHLWNDFDFPLMSQSLLSNHLTPFWYLILTFLRCNQFQSDKIEFNFEIRPSYRGKMAVNMILCWFKGALENSGLQHKIAWLLFTNCVYAQICAWNLCTNIFMNKS